MTVDTAVVDASREVKLLGTVVGTTTLLAWCSAALRRSRSLRTEVWWFGREVWIAWPAQLEPKLELTILNREVEGTLPVALAHTLVTSLRLLRRKASSDKLNGMKLILIFAVLTALVD